MKKLDLVGCANCATGSVKPGWCPMNLAIKSYTPMLMIGMVDNVSSFELDLMVETCLDLQKYEVIHVSDCSCLGEIKQLKETLYHSMEHGGYRKEILYESIISSGEQYSA
jgi:hypothetical protein